MTASPGQGSAAEVESAASVGLADVRAAASRLAGRVHRTPLLTSHTVSELAGATVVMKAEHLQRTGSFKIRGATNALLRLEPDVRARGVVAFSSGNHAQAVAAAARGFGIPATIVMPSDAPAVKVQAVTGYGASIVSYDRYAEDREAIAVALAASTGRAVIRPYDDLGVIAGQGTVGLELAEDAGPLDVVVIPASGGGLAAGVAVALAALSPHTRVVVVEPAAGDDIQRSLAAGVRVSIPQPETIADGIAGQVPGVLTFPLLQRFVAAAVTVTDDELVATMRLLFERTKQVVEPSGAAGLAALLHGRIPDLGGARVAVVLTGGNVGADRFAELLG